MNTKEAIAKLVKIAAQQQKIIAKLAQMPAPVSAVETQTADVAQALVPYLQQAAQGAKGQYGVQSGSLANDGTLLVELTQPKDADVAEYYIVKNKLKEMLAGKTLKSNDGRDLSVRAVNVTGLMS